MNKWAGGELRDKQPPPLMCNFIPSVFNNSLLSAQRFFFFFWPQIITGFHLGERWLLNSSICLCGIFFSCYDSLSLHRDGLSLYFSRFHLCLSLPPSVFTRLFLLNLNPSILSSHRLLHSSYSSLLCSPPLLFHFTLSTFVITSSVSHLPPPTFSFSPTPSDSQMKGCKHVFHMRSHCAKPIEQNNHA